MLIASSLLAKFDADCDEKNYNGKSRCSQITAGVVSFTFSQQLIAALLQFLEETFMELACCSVLCVKSCLYSINTD